MLDKSRSSAFETDPAITALNQKINLGKIAQMSSTQQKDSLPILAGQAARLVERQRREVKQFLVVLQGQPVTPPAH